MSLSQRALSEKANLKSELGQLGKQEGALAFWVRKKGPIASGLSGRGNAFKHSGKHQTNQHRAPIVWPRPVGAEHNVRIHPIYTILYTLPKIVSNFGRCFKAEIRSERSTFQ